METISWDESFSVGVREFDEQHRRIIEIINLLILDSAGDVRGEAISETLTRLTKYTQEHFRAEEEFLAEHGYPDLAVQRDEHIAFRKRVVVFCLDTMVQRPEVPEDLLLYIKDWWVKHIQMEDMQYRAFLQKTQAVNPSE